MPHVLLSTSTNFFALDVSLAGVDGVKSAMGFFEDINFHLSLLRNAKK
jgi:hypothetical protein